MYGGELLTSCVVIHDAQAPSALILSSFSQGEVFTSCGMLQGEHKFPRQQRCLQCHLTICGRGMCMLMPTSEFWVAQSSMQGARVHQGMPGHASLRGEPYSCGGIFKSTNF